VAITAGNVVWNILGDTKRLDAAVKHARTQARGLAQSFMRNSRMIGAGMTAAGGIALAAGNKIVSSWAKAGDEIAKASRRVGVSTETMSTFRHAAEQTGAGMSDVENGFRRMSRFVVDARDGLSTSTDALDRLGVSVTDLDGLSPQQMFWKLAEAVRNVQDPLEQASLAQDIFGRGGTALLPLINEGSEAFAQYAAEAERLGIVFSQDNAQLAEKYTDTMDELSKSFMGAVVALGPLIADHLIPLAEWLRDSVPKLTEWIKGNQGISSSVVAVTGVVSAMLVVLGPVVFVLNQIVALASSLAGGFKTLATGTKSLIGLLGTGLSAALAAVVAAWTAAAIAIGAEWENVKKLFSDGVEWIKALFSPMLDFWGQIGEGIRKLFEGDIWGALQDFGNAFKDYWMGIFGWFADSLRGIGGLLKGLFSGEGIFTGLNNLARFVHGDNAQIAAFAGGTGYAPGGLAMVGERGRELVNLPRGAQVINNNTTERIMQGGGGDAHINIAINNPRFNDQSDARRLGEVLGVEVNKQLRAGGFA